MDTRAAAGDGRLGAITTPPRFRVHQIGRDFVLGVGRDELGVEYVQVFGLQRPAS